MIRRCRGLVYVNCIVTKGASQNANAFGRRFPDDRHGAAATEFVIVLPLLVLFSLAGVDFGRFASVAISMDNAVRVGAERGATRSFTDSTQHSWEDDVKGRVNEELADLKTGWLQNLQITVTTSSTPNNLNRVDVAAVGDFSPIINWPFLGNLVSIRREVSIRQLR